ncbi:DUF1565 domain-containing protein [Microvirga pudoricolor]|uniref:DUF1565 domain-containing protein n=1 Tax=Microvirga pudoricolor TaxID=2778729 RepID=UPI00194FB202|nr:DUF1565 domain-containing protein [Microvirga pudoricolor]MBM6593005.1 DUF1565 domain-containing protein [Microvirga pudoricolor]
MAKRSIQFAELANLSARMIVCASLCGLIPAAPSQAQNYSAGLASSRIFYVSSSGNDNNTGTEEAPFATIQRAADVASPGTTVLVGAGIYRDHIFSKNSGSTDARIRYAARARHTTVIQVAVVAAEAVWKNVGSYVDIEGFDIVGTDGATIGIHSAGSNVRIVGNKVHDFRDLTCSNNGGAGLLLDGHTTEDNDILGNEVYRIGLGNCSDTYFHAVYLSDNGGLVQNNLLYGNRGRGIQTNHGAHSKIITNNLIFDNYDGIAIANWDPDVTIPASGFFVANNIILYSRNWAILEDTGAERNRYVNNLLYRNNNEQYTNGIHLNTAHGSTQTGTMRADPNFVDFQMDGSGNYRLQYGSPGLDSGTRENAARYDFDGTERPLEFGIDLGIYEHP